MCQRGRRNQVGRKGCGWEEKEGAWVFRLELPRYEAHSQWKGEAATRCLFFSASTISEQKETSAVTEKAIPIFKVFKLIWQIIWIWTERTLIFQRLLRYPRS
jgi:hypothetical protein